MRFTLRSAALMMFTLITSAVLAAEAELEIPKDWDQERFLDEAGKCLKKLAADKLPESKFSFEHKEIKIVWKTQEYDVERWDKTGKSLGISRKTGPAENGLILVVGLGDGISQAELPQTLDNDGKWKTYLGPQMYIPAIKKYLAFSVAYGPKTDKDLIEFFSSPVKWFGSESGVKAKGAIALPGDLESKGAISQPQPPVDEFGSPMLAFFLLFALAVCLMLIGAGAVLTIVFIAVLACLLAFGIITTSAIAGLISRRPRTAFNFLFLQVGVVLGIVSGAGLACLAIWIFKFTTPILPGIITGCIVGLLFGLVVAASFNFVWNRLLSWLLVLFTKRA